MEILDGEVWCYVINYKAFPFFSFSSSSFKCDYKTQQTSVFFFFFCWCEVHFSRDERYFKLALYEKQSQLIYFLYIIKFLSFLIRRDYCVDEVSFIYFSSFCCIILAKMETDSVSNEEVFSFFFFSRLWRSYDYKITLVI